MRRFRDLMRAHKRFSFGLWILLLVAVVAGAQWQLAGRDGILTQVLGASTSATPAPTITSVPSNPTAATTATFTYADALNGVGFQCQLDGAAAFSPSSCAKGGVTYAGLAVGSHKFRVAAQSGNGPLSAPALFTWSVVAPTAAPTITQHPADSTADPEATFAFTDTQAGVTFECKLDSASFSGCNSPNFYTDLAVGSHVFQVRAVASGIASSAVSFSWSVVTGSFGISGTLTATLPDNLATLAPGVWRPLNLVFTNPYNFSGGLKVTDVAITVKHATVKPDASGHLVANPDCDGPTNVIVYRAFTGPVTVPRGTAPRSLSDLNVPPSQWPLIKMVNLSTPQDACKNTTFTFTYTGTATKA